MGAGAGIRFGNGGKDVYSYAGMTSAGQGRKGHNRTIPYVRSNHFDHGPGARVQH